MDYQGLAKPALKLAMKRINAMGGCMGCPTCGGSFNGGYSIGGFIGEKKFKAYINNELIARGEAPLKGSRLHEVALSMWSQLPAEAKAQYLPVKKQRVRVPRIVDPVKAERALYRSCIKQCRQSHPQPRAPTTDRQAQARANFSAKVKRVAQLMKANPNISKSEAWAQVALAGEGMRRRRMPRRGMGLEYGGEGLEYGGMQYF